MTIKRFQLSVLIVFLWLITTIVRAESKSYVIYENVKMTIHSNNKLINKISKKYFINDELGKESGTFYIRENEFIKLKKFKGKITDQNGKMLKKIRRKDLTKIVASPGYTLYSGTTYNIASVEYPKMPYILEMEYSTEISSLFFWSSWTFQNKLKTKSVKYTLSVPNEFSFSFFSGDSIPEPKINENGQVYIWEINNIPDWETEYRQSPDGWGDYTIGFSPKLIELDKIEGNFESWEKFGEWYYRLYKDQLQLTTPEGIFGDDTNFSPRQKSEKVLDHIQNDMRYVAVEEGIHGFKPHATTEVHFKKYGDCKDLAMFYIDQLRIYGVPAYPVLILTRDNGLMNEKCITSQFNHAIAMVPLDHDTLWVDCTGKYNLVNDPPYNIEGSKALVVKQNDSQIITLPISKPEENMRINKSSAYIASDGVTTFSGQIRAIGNNAQRFRNIFNSKNDREKKITFTHWLSDYSPNLTIKKLNFIDINNKNQPAVIEFTCNAGKYSSVSHKRMFLNPNFYNRLEFKSEKPEERKTDIFYSYPFVDIDSVDYQLPGGVIIEYLPETIHLSTSFGSYDYSVEIQDNKLLFYRKFSIKKQIIKLEDYADYYQFMETVEKTDKSKVVFTFSE